MSTTEYVNKRFVITMTVLSNMPDSTPVDITWYRGESHVEALAALVQAAAKDIGDTLVPEQMRALVQAVRMDIYDIEPEHSGATDSTNPVYRWYGWTPETENDNDDDRTNVYHLTITRDDEEYAVITHRTCPNADGIEKYPLVGSVAKEKIDRAEAIVAALNAANGVTFYTQGGVGDERAIDPRDIVEIEG